MSALRARLLGCVLALASVSCADSHCFDVRDAGSDGGADSGAICDRAGRAVVGPVLIGLPGSTTLDGCSAHPEITLRIVVLREGREIRRTSTQCGEASDYVDLGELASGEYQIAIDSPDNLVGSGGRVLGHAWCGAGAMRRWCEPLDLGVAPCGLTVTPAALTCDPEVWSCD